MLEVGAIASASGGVRAVAGRALLRVDVDVTRVLDLRRASVQRALGVSLADLRAPWLVEQSKRRFPLTQRIGEAARDERFEAIATPSDADPPDGWNLVIIPETMLKTSFVTSVAMTPRSIPFGAETLRGRMAP